MQPEVIFSFHAVVRMFDRAIDRDEVLEALGQGKCIKNYPDDVPYPSRLVLGWSGKRHLHILAADIPDTEQVVVITVYEPDPLVWDDDLETRKP
ncbi:DUF4258 domain-containing protein [bacterium]|nr:DUF4258 domain-containing protein [bacterium]